MIILLQKETLILMFPMQLQWSQYSLYHIEQNIVSALCALLFLVLLLFLRDRHFGRTLLQDVVPIACLR